MDLFNSTDKIELQFENARIDYYPNFFDSEKATQLFNEILSVTPWQQDEITIFGKTHNQPRLTAFYANNTIPLKYSNITMIPLLFNECLLAIKTKIETEINFEFSSCLINLYRNGNDSNGWHADNEKQLGKNPIIASLSLGAERYFLLKHRTIAGLKHKILLEHGSLMVMKEETQHYWLHQIPKTKKQVGKRINLTFRLLK